MQQSGAIGSHTLPVAASILLLALAALLALQTFLNRHGDARESEHGGAAEAAKEEGWRERLAQNPLSYITATVIYLLCVPFLGFFVPTAVLILFSLTLAKVYSWIGRFAVSTGFLVFAYVVFAQILSVPLPVGPWGF